MLLAAAKLFGTFAFAASTAMSVTVTVPPGDLRVYVVDGHTEVFDSRGLDLDYTMTTHVDGDTVTITVI